MKKILLGTLLLFSGVVRGYCEDVIPATIVPFGTLNNYDSPIVIPNEKAQDLLNVDISPEGKSVKKREGYAQAFALGITTSPTHGVFKFYDSSGNEVVLIFNDTRISASIGGVTPTAIYTTGPNGATWQCVDSQGFAYCNNSLRTGLIKTNGVTVSSVTTVNSSGTLVAVTPDRLVTSGFSGAPNRIDFSGSADFTRWIQPFSAGTDPNQITITAPGSKITHIVYAFNRLIWFKDNSFGYVLFGSSLLDWQVRTISPNVGTLDNSSIYWNDVLYWRGQDGHFYSYDGANIDRMSRDITNTVLQAQSQVQNSWTQTTLSDWQAGISTPTGYANLTINSGSVSLDTATAVTAFNDTSGSDFGSGTLTSVTTGAVSGSLILSTSAKNGYACSKAISTFLSPGPTPGCPTTNKAVWQSFQDPDGLLISSATFILNSNPGSGGLLVEIYSDSSGSPGSLLHTLGTIPEGSISTGAGAAASVTGTPFPIRANTRYWFKLTQVNNTNVGFRVNYGASVCNGTGEKAGHDTSASSCSAYTPFTTSIEIIFSIAGAAYETSGNIVSRTFDVGFTTNTWIWEWANYYASGTIPSNTTLTYQTQTSSSSTGVFDSLVSVSSGSYTTSTVREFIRYKASFTTSDRSTSPVLNDVSINMSKRIRPGATFYSQINGAPNLSSWSSFDATTNGVGSYTYAIRVSSVSFSILSSTPTFATVSPGAIPAVNVSTYMQVRSVITTTSPFAEPQLQAFTQSWFEGLASDKAYGGYYDYALWWNVQLGTSASYNNYVVKYDMINNGFTIYDIPMNGFYVRNGSLYFGSSTGGYVYKYGGVDNDNNAAINAYWKSKDFIGGSGPFMDDDFIRLSLLTNSVQASSMTVTYEINGSSETSFVMPLYDANSSYKYRNLNLPAGKTGTTYNVKFGNNAADQPFELFAIQYGYREKPWVPKQ